VRIEAQSFGGLVGSMNPISIKQFWPSFGQIAVPDLVGLLGHVDAVQFAPAGFVEEAEFDFLRMFGEDGEIDSFTIPGSAEGVGLARPNDGLRLNDHF